MRLLAGPFQAEVMYVFFFRSLPLAMFYVGFIKNVFGSQILCYGLDLYFIAVSRKYFNNSSIVEEQGISVYS